MVVPLTEQDFNRIDTDHIIRPLPNGILAGCSYQRPYISYVPHWPTLLTPSLTITIIMVK
jgi:hypothetical protein